MAPIIKPPALRQGDKIRLIAPSSPAAAEHPDAVARAIAAMNALGFETVAAPDLYRKRDYTAGTRQERAAEIMAAFADQDTRMIWCASGGANSNGVLDLLDYDLIAHNPKILLGFSDITALLNAIHARTGLVTFLGPLAIHNFGDLSSPLPYTQKMLVDVVQHTGGKLILPAAEKWIALRGGQARGKLLGGNLVTLLHLLGTPYARDFHGALLVVEDTANETPARIDRYLTHLRLAGIFDQIAGLIIGRMEPEWTGTQETLARIVQDVAGDYSFPIVANVESSHTHPMLTLPLGIQASLDADNLTLTLDEGAVGV